MGRPPRFGATTRSQRRIIDAGTSEMTARQESGAARSVGLLAIVVLFVVLVFPFFLWPIDPQPDERRYSIAAAEMMATGDYLVPVTETGELRLKKPPLTYYYVVAGFALLGETLAGAKLFFLLSAAAIVALVYPLARVLGASPVAAVFGAAMMAGHRLFFTTSTQYIPDMPLMLGTTAALLGFVHVLRGTARPWHLYLAWLGVAWAVLAKGLLAPLLVVVYVGARWLPGAPALSPRLRRHELHAALLAVAVTLPWFVAMAVLHWEALVADFVGDQVAGKVRFDPGAVLAGIGTTTGSLFLLAFPGLLAVVLARFAAGRGQVQDRLGGPAVTFLLVWIGLNLVLFAFSRLVFGRYALPAAPAVMALAAAYVSLLPADAFAKGLRRAMRSVLPILALVLAGAAYFGFAYGAPIWGLAAAALAVIGVPLLWVALGRRPVAAGILATALFFPLIELAQIPAVQALRMPTVGQVAAARVAARDPSETVLVLHRNAQLVDRIGVELGDLRRVGFTEVPPDLPEAALIIFYEADYREELERLGYRIDAVPVLPRFDIPGDRIGEALRQRDPAAFRAGFGVPLYFAELE